MLEVSQLKRAYGDFIAVDTVSFSIAKGEIVGLLGHNGAGKTTVMKMLSGYLEPSAGRVLFDGLSLTEHAKTAQQKIGYLPESLPVYPEMSVADYLDYAAELKGLSGVEKAAEVKRVILATDISNKLLAPIATLSRGYKQRVGVAQALLGKPTLLILDEPTNGLDPTQTLQMRELIRSIAKDATVILSTHIMQEVDAICDRVLMMRAGKLVIDAKLAELRQSHSILLHTNLAEDVLRQHLENMQGVKSLIAVSVEIPVHQKTLQPNRAQQWRLQLAESTDVQTVSAAVAKLLLAQGGDIYKLQPETRNLESLFREINQTGVAPSALEVMEHAA